MDLIMWFLSLKHLRFFSFYTLKANPNIFKWYKALPVFISTSLTRYTMDDCHQTPVITQHNRMTFNFTITILKLLPILFCLPESTNLPCLPVDLLLLLQCVPQRSFALKFSWFLSNRMHYTLCVVHLFNEEILFSVSFTSFCVIVSQNKWAI